METPSDASDTANDSPSSAAPWRPLTRVQRRVLGVLVEKAKTTPNNYPLTLNAIVTACNQKSNRDPHMDLDADTVEESLDELREMQAVGEVHGDGRVIKYRHYMQDWLGVEGTELAIMAELLLRGTQTIGELRGRAARMAPNKLPDVGSLKPLLDNLIEKKLVVPLSPPGRGQIVTHGLFLADEMDRVRDKAAQMVTAASETDDSPMSSPPAARPAAAPVANRAAGEGVEQLRAEVQQLRDEVARLRKEVEDIWSNLG